MNRNKIEQLKAAFAKRDRIPVDAAVELTALLDKAPEDALVILVRERVKFCWMPALTRLQSKFKWSRDRVDALLKEKAVAV